MHAISIISAIDSNGLIGKDNHLPWQIKEDLQFFRQKTMGYPIIMGRKTWLSIGKPLDGRINVILTHDETFDIPGCMVMHSIEQVLTAFCDKEIFIIGGAAIFAQFLPKADAIYLSRIDHSFDGDTYFPIIDWSEWNIVEYEQKTSLEGYQISNEKWERKERLSSDNQIC